MKDDSRPAVFGNRWANAVGPGGPARDHCSCIERSRQRRQRPTRFHGERQDTSAPGWLRLLELVEEAAEDGRTKFSPLVELSLEERRQVVTLPPTIAGLTRVEHLVLYGSNLVRVPPEIGAMTSLKEFSPYTSYRLHWFPYELTRCQDLFASTVSTRALYGNYKYRPHFPRLETPAEPPADLTDLDPGVWGAESVRSCSVCDGPVPASGPHQVWVTRWVAADVLPLLVNACSAACVQALPEGANGYVRTSHQGGPDVRQPEAGGRMPRPPWL